MTDFSPVRQQDAILADLERLVVQRAAGVQQVESTRKSGLEAVQVKLDNERKQTQAQAQAASQANQAEFDRRRRELEARFEADYRPTEQKYAALKQRVVARYNAEKEVAKKANQEARWETTTVFDATKHKPNARSRFAPNASK
jgi:DNA segregation ATPase FtsK/SpoIIIE, S-DNA-T family